jgi:acetyl esterase/lipase
MIAIPGGGYGMNCPREGEIVAMQFFAEDYQGFCLSYSVAPVRFPWALREACMAVIYIRENADALGVSKNEIAAVGFSAGGHLCGSLGTMFDCPEMDIFGERKALARPDAVLLGYPVISYTQKPHLGSFKNLCGEDEALRRRLSLETQVKENSAPAFIFHTVGDRLVPVKNSLVFASAYEEKGVPFSMHLYESGVHGLSLGNYITDNLTQNNPPRSADFGTWLPMAITWLSERGFAPKQR